MPSSLDVVVRQLPAATDDSAAPCELAGRHEERIIWLEPLDRESGQGEQLMVPLEDIEDWEEDAANAADSRWPPERTIQCHQVVDETVGEFAGVLGDSALAELGGLLEPAMEWACSNYDPAKADFVTFARAVARTASRRFVSQMTWQRLRAEKDDQDRRQAAASDEAALAQYLEHVRQQMTAWLAWRRRSPRREIDEDARSQDQIFAVLTRVLELFRDDSPEIAFERYERAGRPAFWQVRDQVLRDLRRRERMWLVVPAADAIHAHIPRPDEAMLRREIEQRHSAPVADLLRPHLSRRLEKYLDALVIELELDQRRWGVQQRIATRLGRSKSRVSEAMTKIRDVAKGYGLDELLTLDAAEALPGQPVRREPEQ